MNMRCPVALPLEFNSKIRVYYTFSPRLWFKIPKIPLQLPVEYLELVNMFDLLLSEFCHYHFNSLLSNFIHHFRCWRCVLNIDDHFQ